MPPRSRETNCISSDDALGLYIHWPFCASKCPYCDFNSHVAGTMDQGRWLGGFQRALVNAQAHLSSLPIGSIFFGGGTPSLMDPGIVGSLIGNVRASYTTRENLEITLEANPSTSDIQLFEAFAEAGVTRVSVGVQSFDDGILQFLGRRHTAADAKDAIRCAVGVFPAVSFDLMFGWPWHEAADWQRTLETALACGTHHISLYQLTIEDGTAFADQEVGVASADMSAALYDCAVHWLSRAGFVAYEISNFARSGALSRHNLSTWRGYPYVGIGPGAHGRIAYGGRWYATEQITSPAAWLDAVERGCGYELQTYVTPRERAEELLFIGLRLDEGVDRSRFYRQCGLDIEAIINKSAKDNLIEQGLLESSRISLRATQRGRLLLDSVIAALLREGDTDDFNSLESSSGSQR